MESSGLSVVFHSKREMTRGIHALEGGEQSDSNLFPRVSVWTLWFSIQWPTSGRKGTSIVHYLRQHPALTCVLAAARITSS